MIRRQIRHAPGSMAAKLGAQPRGWWGMILAHLGIAVFIVGVTSVNSYEVERDVKISPGEVITVDEYTFKFNGVREVDGPNYRAAQGNFTLFHKDRVIDTLEPEKRVFFARASEMPMTEAAIRSSITGDVYVSLGEPVGDGAWTARIYYKPFVTWIWGGCVLMALGGFVAMSDRRYRTLARREELVGASRGPKPAAA
jgi:cytochrome c-type biogenesis protein CcmF